VVEQHWTNRPEEHHVVVLGASPKATRYSNQAVRLLKDKGYKITPVHPKISSIEGLAAAPSLLSIDDPVHTLTLYVGPERIRPMIADITRLKPGRVIFNPGTESQELEQQLDAAGIPWLQGCTLVMLRTGIFLTP
jgi:predicted CoA-binding protein